MAGIFAAGSLITLGGAAKQAGCAQLVSCWGFSVGGCSRLEHMFERLVSVRGQLAELVTALEPDALSGQTARGWWAEFDRVERLAAAGKTLLARRIADTHRPEQRGTKTAAEELAHKAGTSTGAAKDAVHTSQRLPDQPRIDGALRRGELSSAQAAAISSATAANPAEETRLVELAGQVSLAELREECARVRAAADPNPEATNRRIHAARALHRWIDAEGFWNLHARGSPRAGAAFNTVLDRLIDQVFRAARAEGRKESHEAYGFDALMGMADQLHQPAEAVASNPTQGGKGRRGGGADSSPTGSTGKNGTKQAGAGDLTAPGSAAAGSSAAGSAAAGSSAPGSAAAGSSAPDSAEASPSAVGEPGIFAAGRQTRVPECGVRAKQSVNPRYLALLRVDVQALRRGRAIGGEMCEIAGVGPVSVSVARDVLGEAIVKLVITDGVDVLNVTHLGRGPTAAQKAALLWANPTCSVQGCNRSRLEWDHRQPWAETHHTRLDELDGLCAFHHDLKTRLGYALVPGTGKRAFVASDDPRHPGYRKPPAHRSRRDGSAAASRGAGWDGTGRPPGRADDSRTSAGRRGQQPGLFAEPQPP